MSYTADRRGAANLAPVLMILSFVAMAGLLAWLAMTSEGTDVAVAVEEEEEDTAGMGVEAGAMPVTPEQLRTNAQQFVGGEPVRVQAAVESRIGPQAFFLDFPESTFLVKVDSALAAASEDLPDTELVVVGVIRETTDSVVEDWVGAGAIQESNRILAEFTSHFLEATNVRPATGPDPTGGGAGGQAPAPAGGAGQGGDTAAGGGGPAAGTGGDRD